MVNSTSKKHKNAGIDRLSELSDEILLHILSFLPIVDAVETMLISRFGKLWTLLPSLEFDDRSELNWYDDDDDDDDDEDDDDDDPSENSHRFANFVRNVLILHKKAFLDKFLLSFMGGRYDEYISCFDETKTWLGFAIDRQVKELNVKLNAYGFRRKHFILPHGVLASQSLVTLNLSGLQIDEPRHVHMGSLKTLSLESVKVTNEVIRKIVSGSPSLQRVYLSDVTGLSELRCTAPNVQELHLTSYCGLLDCPYVKILDINLTSSSNSRHLELVDVSSVHEVRIKLCEFDLFCDLLKKFCDAEVFNYSDAYFQSVELKKLDIPQTRWKRLHIDSKLDGDRLLSICNVLRSSPHLEELIIATEEYTKPHYFSDTNTLSLELPFCLLRQLKTVTLGGYAVPCHCLLRLVEALLINSVTLEEMVILPCKNMSASVFDVLKYVKKLSSFPRASTNARVIFGSERCTIMQDHDPEVLRWHC